LEGVLKWSGIEDLPPRLYSETGHGFRDWNQGG
jgi:hypothetical protein